MTREMEKCNIKLQEAEQKAQMERKRRGKIEAKLEEMEMASVETKWGVKREKVKNEHNVAFSLEESIKATILQGKS